MNERDREEADGSVDAARLNAALVEHVARRLEGSSTEQRARVLEAFRRVLRHSFLPGFPLEVAYRDTAIVIKDDNGEPRSSSSQPTIMAVMLEQLGVREGDCVLEIGAGSGYNAAVLAELVGAAGRVVTIDIDPELAASARAKLERAGVGGVDVVAGDGAEGFAPGAPYDRIIATAAIWDLPPAWWSQLAAGGRMVMPLIINGGAQASVAFERADSHLESVSVRSCGFMLLRGPWGRPDAPVALGPAGGLLIDFPAGGEPSAAAASLYRWLTGPWTELPTAVSIASFADLFHVAQWIAGRDPAHCRVAAFGPDAEHGLLPPLPAPGTAPKSSFGSGLADENGIALLALADPQLAGRTALHVRRYGNGEAIGERLAARIEEWEAGGRPTGLPERVRVYRRGATLPAGGTALTRKNSVVVVD